MCDLINLTLRFIITALIIGAIISFLGSLISEVKQIIDHTIVQRRHRKLSIKYNIVGDPSISARYLAAIIYVVLLITLWVALVHSHLIANAIITCR